MKTRELKEVDYYWAEVAQFEQDGTCTASWGFRANKEGRDVFTVKLANEIIDLDNEKYKEKFKKEVDFNHIEMDMTKYYMDEDEV